jgi:hypothetical protein
MLQLINLSDVKWRIVNFITIQILPTKGNLVDRYAEHNQMTYTAKRM